MKKREWKRERKGRERRLCRGRLGGKYRRSQCQASIRSSRDIDIDIRTLLPLATVLPTANPSPVTRSATEKPSGFGERESGSGDIEGLKWVPSRATSSPSRIGPGPDEGGDRKGCRLDDPDEVVRFQQALPAATVTLQLRPGPRRDEG